VFTPTFQIVYLAAMAALFATVALLTRAPLRRVAGALGAAALFTALSAPIDDLGASQGWWWYPSDPPHPPLAIYVGQALEFVGCIALVAWRVRRRFGARGVALLAAAVCILGPIRDFGAAALLPQMIRVGPLPMSLVADIGAWVVVVLVALSGMSV